jgi:hypothetical protein
VKQEQEQAAAERAPRDEKELEAAALTITATLLAAERDAGPPS